MAIMIGGDYDLNEGDDDNDFDDSNEGGDLIVAAGKGSALTLCRTLRCFLPTRLT